MQYFRVTVKMTESSWFVSSQTIQYHSNPNLCPNHWCWRSWSWSVLWRPPRINTKKRCPVHHRGLECKSRKSRDTWEEQTSLALNTKWSKTKDNRIQPREFNCHSKHPFSATQEMTLHMDITRWSVPKSDWLYSLQWKMEKLYTVSKCKTRNWLWLRSWAPYCQIHTEIEESGKNH